MDIIEIKPKTLRKKNVLVGLAANLGRSVEYNQMILCLIDTTVCIVHSQILLNQKYFRLNIS